jgi:hypothetical protein
MLISNRRFSFIRVAFFRDHGLEGSDYGFLLGVFYFFGLGEFLSDFLKREIWREILRETLNNREIFVRLSEPLKNERMKERDSNFMRENERVLLFERI